MEEGLPTLMSDGTKSKRSGGSATVGLTAPAAVYCLRLTGGCTAMASGASVLLEIRTQ